MASVKAFINNGKVNKKGLATVFIRYSHQQQTTDFSTGVQIDPKFWDLDKQIVNSAIGLRKTNANEDLIKSLKRADLSANQKIETLKSEVLAISRLLSLDKMDPDVQAVKRKYLTESGKIENNRLKQKVTELFDVFISDSIKSKATKANYTTALYHIKAYQKKRKIQLTLGDIDLRFYDDFTNFLYKEIEKPDETTGLSDNSVGTSIKNIKVFLTFLKKRGHSIPDVLSDMKATKIDVPIVFLTEEEIRLLEKCEFESATLSRTRDLFIFNCFTGLRYSDLSRFKKYHIIDGAIQMRAYKNQKDVYIPLIPKAIAILEKYDYQLPIQKEQNFNENIKKACAKAGIDHQIDTIKTTTGNKTYISVPKWTAITSHISVKTFISLCGKKGVSPKAVSEITGKSVHVILKHYYGIDQKTIMEQMLRAFA